jgi:predicted Zn-dependent protease
MNRIFLSLITICCVAFSQAALFSQNTVENSVLTAIEQEMQRTLKVLGEEANPPYFLSYSVTEIQEISITASFGELVIDDSDHSRMLDIDIRVGDYQLDNTRQIRGNSFDFGGGVRGVNIPEGNDVAALRAAIWSETDNQYKRAVERYLKVVTNKAVKVQEEDSSADFSKETPYTYSDKLNHLNIDTTAWRERLKRISQVFAAYPFIYNSSVTLRAEVWNKYFINSEGAKLQTSDIYFRVFSQASTKADDGMTLPLFRSYFAYSPEDLPSEDLMIREAKEVVTLLKELRKAPLIEIFSGPVILSGEASGVFFHEIFGHRIEGHRIKDVNSSQTFKNLVGEKILPEFIDVVFDPTITKLGQQDVSGFYRYDDQGVKAQKVTTVKDGKFQSFLMSRSPINNFQHSNGHGRRQPGFAPVARQSNLVVQAKKTVSFDSLKALLREECKKQEKEFGLYFVEIQGGFTFTQRTIPNAFNVQPLVVYKIYADGRPDELVRGVDLIGTPLTTFKSIIASANDLGIFNGVCGAESGGVPVSASSPSLLVSQIEVQKKAKSQAKPPILPSPLSGQKP